MEAPAPHLAEIKLFATTVAVARTTHDGCGGPRALSGDARELVAAKAQERQTAGVVESMARRIAENAVGAVAFSHTGNRKTGEFENAAMLREFGEVQSLEDLLKEG